MAGVRWGVLSTASIGRLVIEASRTADHAELVAVASRDGDRARAFAGELGLEAGYGSYEELLASEAVDAVYVPLPVALHTEWTVKALEAGKHVLCEKPLATSAADAARCFDAAEAAGRHCAEGLMYRHHPQTTLARELVAAGAIGRLAHVRAALTVSVPPGDIRRSPTLGGGALGDLGCYCVSAIRLFASEPSQVSAIQVRDGDAGVDLRMAATLRLAGDVLAQLDVGLDLTRRDELELVGTEGRLVIPDPWLCRAPPGAVPRRSGRARPRRPRRRVRPHRPRPRRLPDRARHRLGRPRRRRGTVVRPRRRDRPGGRSGSPLPFGRARRAGRGGLGSIGERGLGWEWRHASFNAARNACGCMRRRIHDH
jgi:predicted dehydrogenase